MPPLARARRLCAVLAIAALAAPAASAADDPVPIWRGAPALGPAGPGALHGTPAAKAPAGAQAPAADQWIVELAAPPLARYQGGAKGFVPTAPAATGHKLDATSAAARAWSRELSDRQDAALSAVAPSVKPTAEYRTAFAGFAAALTDQQAQALRGRPEVAHVTRERFLHVLDDRPGAQPAAAAASGGPGGSEAALMGLPNGLWKRLGGPAKAGDGVIVGVVDTGITPESASFADHGMAPPALWDGACEAGDQFPSSTCTNKLVGARYFVDGFGRDNLSQGDYLSPRDEVGHGTHVASIAVGDAGVDPRVDGNPLGVDRITGVAPGAHLAVYKACWEMGYCSNVDVISAIDAAVRDGVDVINLSLGAPHDPSRVDPTEAATLNADAAGVFVAVAAGNAGDYPDAISSPATAPWTTAVAATTASRTFRSTLHLSAGGQSADLPASTTWSGFGAVPLLDARSVAPDYQGDAFNDPRFCVAGLTKEQVQGKVVACEAFAPAEVLVDALRPLGAKGVVLVGGDGLDDPIVHSALPMAVIERHELAALRAVTDAGGGTAQLSAPAARAIGWTADRVASFSSRGPASTTADLLRPDVAAPGVNVLAAYARQRAAARPRRVGRRGRRQRARHLGGAPDPGCLGLLHADLGRRRGYRHPASGCRGHDVVRHPRPARGGQVHVPDAHRSRRPRGARRRPRRARGAPAGPARGLLHHAALRRLPRGARPPRGRRSRGARRAGRGGLAPARPQAPDRRVRRRALTTDPPQGSTPGRAKLAAGAAVPRPPRFVTRRPAPRGRRAWRPGGPGGPPPRHRRRRPGRT